MSVTFAPVEITQKEINSFIDQFGTDASKVLAKEIIANVRSDFASQLEENPDYLDYESLRTGRAGFFDDIERTKDLANASRAFSDEDIITQFSTAQDPDLVRGFFAEAFKAGPATLAFQKTAQTVGGRIMPRAISTGNPLAIGTGLLTTLASGAGTAMLTYNALDAIEKNQFGDVAPVPPSKRPLLEAVRTAGSMVGGLPAPYLLPKNIDIGAITFIKNLTEGQKTPSMVNLMAGIERAIPEIARTTAQRPVYTGAVEAASVVPTAGAAYIAEGIDPGGTATRLGLELIAGNILPLTLLRGVPKVLDAAEDAKAAGLDFFSGNAEKRKLFERINEIYAQYATDEEYDQLLENLTNPVLREQMAEAFPGIDFTAGQISDSPIFQTIEAARAYKSEDLKSTRDKNYKLAKQFIFDLTEGLMSEGDPSSIRAAAELRQSYFEDLLSSRLQKNINRLADANSRVRFGQDLGGDVPDADTVTELGEKLAKLTQDSLQLARKEEASLWNLVPNTVIFQENGSTLDGNLPEDLHNYIDKWKNGLGFANRSLDKAFKDKFPDINNIIEEHILNLGLKKKKKGFSGQMDRSQIEPITLKKLIELRSVVLQEIKTIASGEAPDSRKVRKLSEFSQDILDEIEGMDKMIFNQATDMSAFKAYTKAREFSKALNDVFTRSILGRVTRKTHTGEKFQTPEMLLEQLRIGKNATLTTTRLAQLRNFSEFMEDLGPMTDQQTEAGLTLDTSEMSAHVDGILEDYLRKIEPLVGEEIFDPKSGRTIRRVNEKKLGTWLEQNEQILDEYFPQLKLDLQDAQSAERLFKIFEQRRKSTQQKRKSLSVIRDLANLDVSPIQIIDEAFGRRTGPRDLKSLFNLGVRSGRPARDKQIIRGKIAQAESSEEEVSAGFKNAIVQFALHKAGGEGEFFSPKVFYETLFSKMPKSDVSLMDVATSRQYDIFSPEEAKRLKFMSEQLAKIQKADETGKLVDDQLVESFGGLRELYARAIGAVGGGALYQVTPGATGPASLVFGQAGSKYAQEIFLQLPLAKKMDLLDTIFLDPDLVAATLRRPNSKEASNRQVSKVRQLLEEKGFSIPYQLQPEIIREAFQEEGDPEIDKTLEELSPEEREALQGGKKGLIKNVLDQISAQPAAPRTAPAPMPAPAIAAAPPSPPVNRARFAAMFPNDPMSALIRQQSAQQGIGSLMG